MILLDNRYESDEESLFSGSSDVLGEDQWLWLDLAIKRGLERNVTLTVVGAGIQMLPEQIYFPPVENFRWKNR